MKLFKIIIELFTYNKKFDGSSDCSEKLMQWGCYNEVGSEIYNRG